MSTITRERAELKAFITGFLTDPAHDNQSSRSLTAEVFRIALASLESEPVAWISERNLKNLGKSYSVYVKHKPVMVRPIPLYTATPAPVVDADDNFYSWFGREWHEHYQQNQYTTAAKQMLGVMAESAWKAGRRAAMLQGAENVESPTTMQTAPSLDSSQIIAESPSGNSPVIPDCSCGTCRPVTFTDSRFVVCSECGNKRCPHANDHRNACTGSNDPGQEGSAYPAAPQQETK